MDLAAFSQLHGCRRAHAGMEVQPRLTRQPARSRRGHPRAPRRPGWRLDPPRRWGDPRWLGWPGGGGRQASAKPRRRILGRHPGQAPVGARRWQVRRARGSSRAAGGGWLKGRPQALPDSRKAKAGGPGSDRGLQRRLSSRIGRQVPGALSSTAAVISSSLLEAHFPSADGPDRRPHLREAKLVQRYKTVARRRRSERTRRKDSRRWRALRLLVVVQHQDLQTGVGH